MNKGIVYSLLLAVLTLLLVVLNLFHGSVQLPFETVWNVIFGQDESSTEAFIILQSRLPQTVVALLSGAALAVCGLLLQTIFSNPLADPSILGINSGAGLGVGIVILVMGGSVISSTFSFSGFFLIVLAAFIGASAVMLLLLFFSNFVRSNLMLLIIGIMISYAVSSVISLLNYMAAADSLQAFMMWGMGSFNGVSLEQLLPFSMVMVIGLVASLALVKPLNAMLLGENYAANLGINIRRTRTLLLIVTGLLSAVTTAFCGPIAFIGLAVPHIARLILGTANHRQLLPVTLFCGSTVALLCNFICILPGDKGLIPLNVVTPLFGVPIIIYVLLSKTRNY